MADEALTRYALDGKLYTEAEFQQFYGWHLGNKMWREAASASDPNADSLSNLSYNRKLKDVMARGDGAEGSLLVAPLAGVATSASSDLSIPTASASEHAGCVLNEGDLEEVRAQSAALHRSALSLHQEARALLANLAEEEDAAPIDLQPRWPTWREYLAFHSKGNEIVGPGVVAITAERIAGTSDPNRYGRKRLDFFVHRMDGSAYRLHPGQKKSLDAKPVYLSSLALKSTRGLGDTAVLPKTLAVLKAIPQSDRYGKNSAFNKLLELKCEHGEDLTDERKFAWPLFFSNLGRLFDQVVGQGVAKVRLMQQHEDKISLEVTNSEGVALLHLRRNEGRQGMDVKIALE